MAELKIKKIIRMQDLIIEGDAAEAYVIVIDERGTQMGVSVNPNDLIDLLDDEIDREKDKTNAVQIINDMQTVYTPNKDIGVFYGEWTDSHGVRKANVFLPQENRVENYWDVDDLEIIE